MLKFYLGIDAISNHVAKPVTAQQIASNIIVSMQHWSADLKDETGKVNHLHGDSALTYERVNDEWKIAVLSFNSSQTISNTRDGAGLLPRRHSLLR